MPKSKIGRERTYTKDCLKKTITKKPFTVTMRIFSSTMFCYYSYDHQPKEKEENKMI